MTGFAKGLEVGCDNKRGVMADPKVFGLNKWKNGIAEMARTVWAAVVCGLSFAVGRLEILMRHPGGNVQ